MGLLPGYRFCPTELELIRCYLLNKVTGNPIPGLGLDNVNVMNPVIECDLYGDPTIWMNIFEETGMKCLYFYTKLKMKKKMGKKSDDNNGNRVERSTQWGTWRGQSDGKVCQNRIHVGSKRSFTYAAKKGFNANNIGWVMYEYRLDGIYGNHRNQVCSLMDSLLLFFVINYFMPVIICSLFLDGTYCKIKPLEHVSLLFRNFECRLYFTILESPHTNLNENLKVFIQEWK